MSDLQKLTDDALIEMALRSAPTEYQIDTLAARLKSNRLVILELCRRLQEQDDNGTIQVSLANRSPLLFAASDWGIRMTAEQLKDDLPKGA